ncbi:unnamed protein product [Rodentolepis nana]|uniref:PDZ domain-containing protein n=1 Tax=Rodentolepis nana TaxID=102285 RepID=A0A0R3T5P5_RODNA|nr:unnamed protein product [Rodentolepis nana]
MTTVSPSGCPNRVSWGKRAKRTVTAPSVSGRLHSADGRAPVQEPQLLSNRYASQDNGVWPFSSSGYLSPRLTTISSTCLRDVKEVFTVQQIMRDTLETRLKPQSADKKVIQQRNHHKKEFLRSWSRERIIVTEEIIYPTTNLSVTSASGSYSSIAGPQSKPYYPLERYNTTSGGNSLPVPSITMIGALPQHVVEHGKSVPLSSTNISKTTHSRDRRANLRRQASESEGSTLLFSDLSSVGSSIGARVIPIKKGSKILSVQSLSSPQTMENRPSTVIQTTSKTHFLNAMTYMLMEHADEDQFVQNILPLRPVEPMKSHESISEDNLRCHPVIQRVPIIEHSLTSSFPKISSNPTIQASIQRSETLTPKNRQQSPRQMVTASDVPPSSPPPDYQSIVSDERDSTFHDDEDIHSTSTSVYETARSSISPSPTRDLIVTPIAQTQTLQSAPPQHFLHYPYHGSDITTNIDKLDAATETVIPTSPVYFRTIVRRDHAGYGLTVCGTNPVTVRNIREGKLLSKNLNEVSFHFI